MNLPVILTEDALSDLQDAHDWYNKQKAGLGVVFIHRAKARLATIGQSPELYGKTWKNIRATTIHKHPYVIYYRILSDCVEVLAILHGSRHPSVWQSRV